MIIYLSSTEAGEYAGVKPSTFRAYIVRNQAPKPDAMIGNTPGWLPETIDDWMRNRPGRGARTDLKEQ